MSTPDPLAAPTLPAVIAAHLDASERVRDDWRNFFQFHSVRWTLAGMANAATGSITAALLVPSLVKTAPYWIIIAFQLATFIGTFYGILTKQASLKSPTTE